MLRVGIICSVGTATNCQNQKQLRALLHLDLKCEKITFVNIKPFIKFRENGTDWLPFVYLVNFFFQKNSINKSFTFFLLIFPLLFHLVQ